MQHEGAGRSDYAVNGAHSGSIGGNGQLQGASGYPAAAYSNQTPIPTSHGQYPRGSHPSVNVGGATGSTSSNNNAHI